MMKTFAFIFFPQTIRQLRRFLSWRKIIPRNTLPFKISRIKKIRSIQEKEIQGYLIACPLISQCEGKLEQGAILERLIYAGDIARQLGVDILGLDINLPAIDTQTKLKIPFTNGHIFTAWSIFEAVYRIAKIKNLDFKDSTLVISAESAAIKALCTDKLSAYIPRIVTDADYKVEADILIYLNETSDSLYDRIKALKSGCIVFVVNLDKNTIAKLNLARRDITIIRAGLIKLPFPVNLGINLGLPKGIVNAPLAETMLMALEDKVPSYSLSGDRNPEKLEELADIAVQHGFEVWVPEAPVL